MSQQLVIPCTKCGARLKLGDRSKFGRKVACPRCQNRFIAQEPRYATQPAVAVALSLTPSESIAPAVAVSVALPVAVPVALPIAAVATDVTTSVPTAVPVAKVVAASVISPEMAARKNSSADSDAAIRVSAPGKVPTVSWKNPEAWAEVKLSSSAEPQSFKLPEETRLRVAQSQHRYINALLGLILIGGAAGVGFYAYTNPAQLQQWQALLITSLPESLRPTPAVAPVAPPANPSTETTDPVPSTMSQEHNLGTVLDSSTSETTPELPVRAIPDDRDPPQQLLTSPRHASARSR